MMILQCCLEGDDDNQLENKDVNGIDKEDEQSDQESNKSSMENCSETENREKDKKPYCCSLCSRSFTSEIALQNHMWGHPTYLKRIRIFNTAQPSKLILAPETESNDSTSDINKYGDKEMDEDSENEGYQERRYSCPICGKVISTKGNLKVHLETHRPKGRYGCDICGRM